MSLSHLAKAFEVQHAGSHDEQQAQLARRRWCAQAGVPCPDPAPATGQVNCDHTLIRFVPPSAQQTGPALKGGNPPARATPVTSRNSLAPDVSRPCCRCCWRRCQGLSGQRQQAGGCCQGERQQAGGGGEAGRCSCSGGPEEPGERGPPAGKVAPRSKGDMPIVLLTRCWLSGVLCAARILLCGFARPSQGVCVQSRMWD